MNDDVCRFLNFLHPNGGYRDFRAISSDRKTAKTINIHPDNWEVVEDFINGSFTDGLNKFVGVAARKSSKGNKLPDCSYLLFLFVDQDYKAITEEEARAIQDAFPFPPSIRIQTGAGAHLYYGLTTALDPTKPRTKVILRQLARHLKGDLNAATPERILRIPGTLNYKYDPPRPVLLDVLDESRLYNLEDILHVIGPIPDDKDTEQDEQKKSAAEYDGSMPLEDRISKAKRWLKKQPPAISGHGGDSHTFNICCSLLIGFDIPLDHVFATLEEWNKRCEPPWSEEDLKRKAHNADQYGDKNNRGSKLVLFSGKKGINGTPSELVPTAASSIRIRPVYWGWKNRLPLGELSLLAGREGLGKSTLGYQLVADVSQGRMEGYFHGTSRSVFIVAAEDSWEHTIVPRLIAGQADLTKIFRIDAKTVEGIETAVSLPKDLVAFERLIYQYETGMVLLDPLMSRLDSKLDSHKDADVRQALEPMVKLAHDTNVMVLGIIHVNKSSGTDPLSLIMGSRAFSAVSRAVLYIQADADQPQVRLMGQAKNNLGRTDLPTLQFSLEEFLVRQTTEGAITTAKLTWLGESTKTIGEEIELSQDQNRTQIIDAVTWLKDYLTLKGGQCESDEIKKAAKREGSFSESTIKRAGKRVPVLIATTPTFPKRTYWYLKGVTVKFDTQDELPTPF